jgi:hypothetical protein
VVGSHRPAGRSSASGAPGRSSRRARTGSRPLRVPGGPSSRTHSDRGTLGRPARSFSVGSASPAGDRRPRTPGPASVQRRSCCRRSPSPRPWRCGRVDRLHRAGANRRPPTPRGSKRPGSRSSVRRTTKPTAAQRPGRGSAWWTSGRIAPHGCERSASSPGAVGRGRIDKVVLARRVVLEAPFEIDVAGVLRRLARSAPESTTMHSGRDGTTFLGATRRAAGSHGWTLVRDRRDRRIDGARPGMRPRTRRSREPC